MKYLLLSLLLVSLNVFGQETEVTNDTEVTSQPASTFARPMPYLRRAKPAIPTGYPPSTFDVDPDTQTGVCDNYLVGTSSRDVCLKSKEARQERFSKFAVKMKEIGVTDGLNNYNRKAQVDQMVRDAHKSIERKGNTR